MAQVFVLNCATGTRDDDTQACLNATCGVFTTLDAAQKTANEECGADLFWKKQGMRTWWADAEETEGAEAGVRFFHITTFRLD